MLEAVGCQVSLIEAGCCGMAGAFGYEAEHYELSMKIGELALFPAVRDAGEEVIVSAAGISCQSQIEDGTQVKAIHPIKVVQDVISRLRLQNSISVIL
jgi:Fe-S oxidoreductase